MECVLRTFDTTSARKIHKLSNVLQHQLFTLSIVKTSSFTKKTSISRTAQVAALFANGELIVNFYGHPQRALIFHGAFCLSRAYIAAGKTLLNNYAREILPVVARSYAETLSLNVHTAFLERLNSWADYDADLRMIRYGICR